MFTGLYIISFTFLLSGLFISASHDYAVQRNKAYGDSKIGALFFGIGIISLFFTTISFGINLMIK